MLVTERFHIEPAFIQSLKDRPVPWGFGLFSSVVYYRTYSRQMANGGQEQWYNTVTRVVEGAMSIRKDWYLKHDREWNETRWQGIAQKLASFIYDMKLLPPGRGLWAMGTEYIYERGSMALNNCGYVDVKRDLADAAGWAMNALMCGVGVGFSTENVNLGDVTIPPQTIENTSILEIPDSREGWVDSVKHLINSYFKPGSAYIIMDYSKIRPEGAPLKGFGGLSGGPEPLVKLHTRLRAYFENYKRLGGSTRLIADVFNAIGACVVAGNIRRSAEIAIGNVYDNTFLNLKNYDAHPERSEIGWMSNNSVILKQSDEFELLPGIANRIRDNGEPGIINLINIQKYARVGKKKVDHAIGFNPCFTGDTKVWTLFGPMRFDELVGQEIPVLTQNEDGKLIYRKMYDIRVTGKQEPIYRLITHTGKKYSNRKLPGEVRVTGNHIVFLSDGTEIAVKDLQPGDSLSSVYRRKANQKGYLKLYNTAGDYDMEHRIIAAWETDNRPEYPEFHVDHKDEDKTNNLPENLRILHHSIHNSEHMLGEKNPVIRFPERNLGAFKKGHSGTTGFSGRQHSEETKEKCEILTTTL